MEISQLITGVVMVVGGLVLLVVGIFAWPALIYGIPIFILGVLILFNVGREDKVEKVKTGKLKKKK